MSNWMLKKIQQEQKDYIQGIVEKIKLKRNKIQKKQRKQYPKLSNKKQHIEDQIYWSQYLNPTNKRARQEIHKINSPKKKHKDYWKGFKNHKYLTWKLKQAIQNYYWLNSQQLKYVKKYAKRKNQEILTVIESKLDILIYRMKLASTIQHSRWLIENGYIKVNQQIERRADKIIKTGSQIQSQDIRSILIKNKRNINDKNHLNLIPKYITEENYIKRQARPQEIIMNKTIHPNKIESKFKSNKRVYS